MNLGWRLFPKYATLISALVGGMLVASGGIGLYFSYIENQQHLIALQREKAQAAATRIEQYVRDIEHQLGWVALAQASMGDNLVEQRRFEYLKLLRQVPAITEVAWVDASGREQIKVSRLAMDESGKGTDLSKAQEFLEAKSGKSWYSPVYFRNETEPYMTISRPAGSGGVTIAEVNLKFVWDVVSRIRIGQAGLAFVVSVGGTLIAHPDISLVLKKTDMSMLPQVAALAAATDADEDSAVPSVAHDLKGVEVLTAHARIPTLNWTVFVELPLAEAFGPVYASFQRLGLLLLAGLVMSMIASFFLARLMVRPIRVLQEGAQRVGQGKLDQQIDICTGDELESLAGQFNQMAAQLKESYAGLERKVGERTTELRETLDYQVATAEILQVISSSPTDVQPVFDTIAERVARLCEANFGFVFTFDGELIHLRSAFGLDLQGVEAVRRQFPLSPEGDSSGGYSIAGRTISTGAVVHISDILADPQYALKGAAEVAGFRGCLGVPMLRDGRIVGSISVIRVEVGCFSDKQVELLKTFASQAVIAIQNVRLFKEIEARNSDLTESLEQQTATSEILRVISSSPSDVQPVFDIIAESAVQLCRAQFCAVLRLDGDLLHLVAHRGLSGAGLDAYRRVFPTAVSSGTVAGRSLLDRAVVQIPDVHADADYAYKSVGLATPFQAIFGIPLLREGQPLGSIAVSRTEPGSLSEREVEVLKTFADQAVIAIENVRLFNEIQEKSLQLELANRHKSEFLSNMSHELRTPLNAIIGFSEVLLERMFGEMNEKQEDYLKDIHSSGQHLLSLINDILDLAKVEAGRMELNIATFDLPAAIDNALALIRERAMRHRIALAVDVDPQLGQLNADERKLKQILLNLLSNAVKFTPEGGRITVTARLAGRMVEIAVSDTGIGIAAEDHAAVFEEFKQVGTDYTRKAEGTGLGLALTRKLVILHGGAMRLESEPGKGSTFAFTLPLKLGAPGSAATFA